MTRIMWFAASVIAAIILAALFEVLSWYSNRMWTKPLEEYQSLAEWEADHAGA